MKQMFSKEELQEISKEVADTEIDENLIANPTLEGDEETLSSIGIKGTNYAVGGGSEVHLYRHLIKTAHYQRFTIFTNESSPITTDSLKEKYQGTYLSQDIDNSQNTRITNGAVTVSSTDITYRYIATNGNISTGTTTVSEDEIVQMF